MYMEIIFTLKNVLYTIQEEPDFCQRREPLSHYLTSADYSFTIFTFNSNTINMAMMWVEFPGIGFKPPYISQLPAPLMVFTSFVV